MDHFEAEIDQCVMALDALEPTHPTFQQAKKALAFWRAYAKARQKAEELKEAIIMTEILHSEAFPGKPFFFKEEGPAQQDDPLPF